MTTSTLSVSVDIDGVTSLVISDLVQDLVTGLYVRELRVFGTPAAGSEIKPLVYSLRLNATARESLTVTSPQSTF